MRCPRVRDALVDAFVEERGNIAVYGTERGTDNQYNRGAGPLLVPIQRTS